MKDRQLAAYALLQRIAGTPWEPLKRVLHILYLAVHKDNLFAIGNCQDACKMLLPKSCCTWQAYDKCIEAIQDDRGTPQMSTWDC